MFYELLAHVNPLRNSLSAMLSEIDSTLVARGDQRNTSSIFVPQGCKAPAQFQESFGYDKYSSRRPNRRASFRPIITEGPIHSLYIAQSCMRPWYDQDDHSDSAHLEAGAIWAS